MRSLASLSRRHRLPLATALLAVGLSSPAFAQSNFITASSVYDDGYRAEFALDGDLSTRWASRGDARFPAWLQIDLGSVTSFDRMIVHWETAHATEYEIQSSENGISWKTVLRKTDGQAGKVELGSLAARGRYVRISALKPKGSSHVSIWEVEFPESHVAAALASTRQAEAEKRARQMRETLARVTQSGAKEIVFAARPVSYFTLTARNQVADGRNRAKSNYAPRTIGSGGSALMAKLEPSHHDVKLSPLERKTVRLWIEIGAPYPGTYAALGCGMIGGYDQNTLDRSAEAWPSTQAATEALRRRCGSCHAGALALPVSVCDEIVAPPWEDMSPNDPRRQFSRHLLYDLTRPEKSPLLLAALAKEAGGLALCRTNRQDTNSVISLFKDTADPDYVKIHAAIADAKKKLDEIKRFDMPGFQPRAEWVREMKRYGVLPESASGKDGLDVYAIERSYWESLWPKAQPALAERNPMRGKAKN